MTRHEREEMYGESWHEDEKRERGALRRMFLPPWERDEDYEDEEEVDDE